MHDTDSLVATAVDLGAYSPNASRAFHDPDGDEPLAHTVLEALEKASEQPADEMSVRLYDAIDPDALNDLFDPTRSGPSRDTGRVSFTVGEFAVDVHATGHVFVQRTS
jgi:hypothetical protein